VHFELCVYFVFSKFSWTLTSMYSGRYMVSMETPFKFTSLHMDDRKSAQVMHFWTFFTRKTS